MPVFVYVLLGIALFITILCISKLRLIITYEDDLKVYAKFWFLHLRLYPEKPKKPKKDKKKPKPPTHTEDLTPKKKKSIVSKLWEMRTLLSNIIAKFLNKLHFKFIRLKIKVSCENAASTALAYSGATQGVAYIIEILDNISNVDISSRSDISVDADFLSLESELQGKIELYIRVLPLAYVGICSLADYIKFKSTKED